eukprot:4507374-Prymnesium_polylepis.1
MASFLRGRAGTLAAGVPFGVTLCGAINFLLEFPEPLPSFVDAANSSDGVGDLIGTPVSRSLFWSGKATRTQAKVSIPVSGVRGSGTLTGWAVRPRPPPGREAPPWEIISLDVVCDVSGK